MGQIKIRVAAPAAVGLKVQNIDIVKAVSPTVALERNQSDDGVTLTVTDVNEEHRADIYDGKMDTRLIGGTERGRLQPYGICQQKRHDGYDHDH